MDHVDRAAIFQELCHRNQVRKAGGLKLLNIRQEYQNAVKVAEASHLRAIRQQYIPEVRAEILEKMRAKYGPHWPDDLGSRYLLGALTNKLIAQRYGL